MNRKESNRRLLKLAKHLESVPAYRFDYRFFTGRGASEFSCGTNGCALGHAVEIPEFQKLGLHIREVLGVFHGVSYKGINDPFASGVKLFGISRYESDHLFAPINAEEPTRDPVFVAQKIRDFVVMR